MMQPHDDKAPAAHSAGFVKLGDGRTVCRMGLGTMRLTGPGIWGAPADRSEAIRVLRTAVELGVQLIDTADSYGPDIAEELIAEALWPYPDAVVVTTKAGYERPGPDRWTVNGRPQHLARACEDSLRRLRLECHPLYQLHGVDPAVPFADSLGALIDLRAQGKIDLIGVSNVDHAQLLEASRMTKIASVQNRFNRADRSSDPIIDECERRGIVFIPYSPLQDGKAASASSSTAAKGQASPAQETLRWLLERSPMMLPIPGTSSAKHLIENVGAVASRGALQ